MIGAFALGACLFSTLLAAEEPHLTARPVAQLNVGVTRIDWLPLVDYERLVLTVAGPKDLLIREEIEAGQSPSLGLFDSSGRPLPDGMYTYELRALPRKKAGEPSGELRQSGYLAVRGGSFLIMDSPDPRETHARSPIKRATAETTISDGLIVQPYGACIGEDCGPSDTISPMLVLKDGEMLRVLFDDVPDHISANHDWALQANDLFAGGGEYFSIVDRETFLRPFTVEGYAPDASLYVRSNGNVGLGTSTPAVRLDVKGSAAGQATARLQNSSATGYSGTEYLDNAGNVGLFFGVDNAASTTRLNSVNNNPIVILTNSTERMRVTSGGKVGIGTSSPADKLHVFENVDANTLLTVENPNTGLSANGTLRAKSDTATVNFQAHGSGRTLSRFGQTLGSWAEFLQVSGNGLIIGTLVDKPLILGTNSTNRLQIGGTGGVTVNGNFTVTGTKNFAVVDPEDAHQAIYYAALEGPEAGTYFRGTAKTSGGEAVIELPDYFARLTEPERLTVQLTPVGAWGQLYVAEKTPNRLVVRMPPGSADLEFDYFVQGVRKGYLDYQVKRPNTLPQ
jgi:hypothetical protein